MICPEGAETAIVVGAIYLGLDPSRIAARVARDYYAVEVYAPWNDKIHSDKTLKVEDKKTGKSYCKSSSYTIFQADQKVNYTEEIVVKEPFIPLYPEQCYMKLRFFSSRQPFPSTLNASFQEKSVGNLLIRMSRGNERKVILRLSLQERIIAKARDQTSGKEYECILDPSGATNQQNNQIT